MKNNRTSLFTLFMVASLLLIGCVPVMEQAPRPLATEAAAPDSALADAAMATVNTRSLRVRNTPSVDSPVVWGINNGESYKMIARSSDGLWLQLEIPAAPDGKGWVAADLVTVEGAITDAVIVEVPTLRPVPTVNASTASTTTASTPVEANASVTNTQPVEISTPPAGYALVLTDGTRLRVRAEPNNEAEIVGYVYAGEVYPLLESSADGLWSKLGAGEKTPNDNPNGGWVATEFLLIGQ